jgi:hypothetical protein
MSAQGGTLQRRGTIELPIWPVAVLLIAAIAAAIGITMLSSEVQTTFVTSISESERLANSSAAVREHGATLPSARSRPTSTGYAGFENPAANGTVAWGSIGGPNEALHRQYSPPREDVAPETGPITINGGACMQCR